MAFRCSFDAKYKLSKPVASHQVLDAAQNPVTSTADEDDTAFDDGSGKCWVKQVGKRLRNSLSFIMDPTTPQTAVALTIAMDLLSLWICIVYNIQYDV